MKEYETENLESKFWKIIIEHYFPDINAQNPFTFLSRLQLSKSWFSPLVHLVFPRTASILKLIILVT